MGFFAKLSKLKELKFLPNHKINYIYVISFLVIFIHLNKLIDIINHNLCQIKNSFLVISRRS